MPNNFSSIDENESVRSDEMLVKTPCIEIPIKDMEKVFPDVDLQGRKSQK